jgi:hypothetical protein
MNSPDDEPAEHGGEREDGEGTRGGHGWKR